MNAQLPVRTMDDFRDVIYTFRLSRVIATAMDLDLFTHMGSRFWTPKSLANTLKTSERGVEIILRNLKTAGLLMQRGTSYRAEKLGRTFLNRNSPDYQGAYLELVHRQWEDWAHLTDSVRTGKPVEHDGPDDPDYRRSFTWAMHQRSIRPARQVAAQLDLNKAQTLLDVGGGPGTYALEFLKKNSTLRAGIWDRQPALEVAQEIAQPLRHGKRLSYYPGDLFENPVPGKFDVTWMSNVLHIFSPAENKTLFKKLKRALNPGGRILIQDTFLMNKPGCDALETNLFAVTMLLFTPTGNTYSAQDVQQWLKTCGLKKTRCLQLKKGTGDWDGVIIEGRA
ncbi:MAG: methyltransferase [Nitrospira sp.]|nr:methyltransferase [Nitrospira sp.]MDE0404269.1 methyltransferase [Nitrospira sp.]MDE0487412.1 methyltransferase [Nitrospira sp.]